MHIVFAVKERNQRNVNTGVYIYLAVTSLQFFLWLLSL